MVQTKKHDCRSTRRRGRKPQLNEKQITQMIHLWENDQSLTVPQIAKQFEVSKTTVYNYINNYKQGKYD